MTDLIGRAYKLEGRTGLFVVRGQVARRGPRGYIISRRGRGMRFEVAERLLIDAMGRVRKEGAVVGVA